jgi:serine/threonine protein kinase
MLPIAPDTLLQQRYRILNILEEGGLVRTYLATDRQRADAYCAIEELTPFSQFSSAVVKAKELFRQEASLLEGLDLPQLPRFWTTFEDQNRLFLVRDYIQGKTYGQILAEHRDRGTVFGESEVWQLLLQILPAIGYIHAQGVIHRDICPINFKRCPSMVAFPSDARVTHPANKSTAVEFIPIAIFTH